LASLFFEPTGALGTCAECRGVQSDGAVLIVSSNRCLDTRTFHPETVATNTFLLICFDVEMREMDDFELMRHTAQDYMKI
jgi:CheY-like chemotaxis protein